MTQDNDGVSFLPPPAPLGLIQTAVIRGGQSVVAPTGHADAAGA